MSLHEPRDRQRYLALALMVLPLATVAFVVLWALHRPDPQAKPMAAIDRNSLLPHRYAGPCGNCHRILENGPVALNRNTMGSFQLSQRERSLLLAGQRVDVPTLSQKLSIPAITRTDILPHPFLGVCCNCHVILNVQPSATYMREAMGRAFQPLGASELGANAIAHGGFAEDERRARNRVILGYLALPLALLTMVFVALRWSGARGGRLQNWCVLHQLSGLAFAAAAVLHWYYSDRGNNFLHLAFVGVLWLTLAGLILRVRLRRDSARGGLLLHTQRFLTFILLALVVLGHFFSRYV